MAKRADNQGRGAVASTADDASLSSIATEVPSHLAVVGKGMRHNNLLLPSVLQASIQRWYPWSGLQQRFVSNAQVPEAFIGWGHKKSYQRAKKAANRQQLTTLSIEDGFLRSLDSGTSSRHALSVVVDDVGIYFDLTRSSRLEQMIVARGKTSSDSKMLGKKHAQQLITRICEEKLSKYNAVVSCPSLDKLVAEKNTTVKQDLTTSHVLLIDQVAGDASIKGAGADKRQFKRMLKAACRNHPDAYIWIKAHPAAKSGYLTDLKLPKNVRLLTQALNPIALLEQVDHVYTVSSHMGFEALMLGKEVHCFGVNWYSGWGLTDDSGAPQQLFKTVTQRRLALADKLSLEDKASLNLARREQGIERFTLSRRTLSKRLRNLYKTQTSIADKRSLQVTLETLFYSAYIDYSRYVDPATKQACNIETAIDWLVTNRYWQARLAGDLTVYEFSRWKLPFVKAFVKFPTTTLFIKPKPRLKNLLHPDHLRVSYQQPLLVWGLAKRQQVQKQLRRKLKKLPLSAMPAVYCMEDGFIRSNGLGATLLAPLSVVIDQQGIYYDATQPSDLETLLSNCAALTPQQTARVQLLQDKLLTQKVSKYNVGLSIDNEIDSTWITKAAASGKQRLLIVGQVEDDLSVQHCGSDIKTNRGLIERVRRDNPDAYLIYKPHPDVEAGLRVGKVNAESLRLVDAVAYDTAMPDCLARVDEVHTISSLTGFEALLRGLQVTCYGLPFYAGWGLTVDVDAHLPPKSIYLARRKRDEPLSLEQLIHCTLIRYPLYRLPEGHGLAQVEQVIDYLYPVTEASTTVLHHKTDGSTHSLIRSSKRLSLPKKQLYSLVKRLQRRAMTRFMQQRHQWHQRRKSSSGL